MTSPTQFHVFLSAVSSEFLQERVQLENWFERKGSTSHRKKSSIKEDRPSGRSCTMKWPAARPSFV